MKKNWLTLDSNTFLWVKGEEGLLYNAQNACSFHFASIGQVKDICNNLMKIDNLYSTDISNNQLKEKDVITWINTIVANKIGYFTLDTIFEARPVSLMPILKIQDDIQRYVWEYNRGIQGAILNNLHEVFFYINGTATGEKELYKQITFPFKTDECLDYHDIVNFCHNSQNPYLMGINIVGSLFTYPSHQNLLDELTQLHIRLEIIVTDLDYLHYEQAYTDLAMQKDISIQVMVRNIDSIQRIFANQDHLKNISCHFLISSESEYECVLDEIERNKVVSHYQIIPIVRNNLDFLKEFVYLDIESIEEIRLSKREIFIRQSINLNDFGKMTILPNGSVHSNVNCASLGTIKDLPIDLVYKEFLEGQSWLNVRKQKPCSNCVYQWLCPSPSNIEALLGKNNLCFVKK